MEELNILGAAAKKAAAELNRADTKMKNAALDAISRALRKDAARIVKANQEDMALAGRNGLAKVMLDRLMLNKERVDAIADAVVDVKGLSDPVGETIEEMRRPNGLKIFKKRVPFGVVAMIYEARPNVTADAAALCLKTSNAVILRGGKEAYHTNITMVEIMRGAIESAGLCPDCIQALKDTSRETAAALMRLNRYVDLLIPRGGAGLIDSVVQNATVPIIETGKGNCHVYIDCAFDKAMALDIIDTAKTGRPSVCNAIEKVLVHEKIARDFLPEMAARLAPANVEIRGDAAVCDILPFAKRASGEDWSTEYNDYILGVKVVKDVSEAIAHINRYGTMHSEAIITDIQENAEKFLCEIDAAAVYHNASTRFTDGGEFGFGAEIGISTQKMHARGPMGLREMTTYKYIVCGSGQTR